MTFPLRQQSSFCGSEDERDQSCIETLYKELNSCKRTLEELLARQTDVQNQSYLKKMLVKLNGRIIILNTDDIEWIEAWGDYVRLHCRGRTHVVRQKIGDIELRLDPNQFLRIGRSAIVHVNCIKELEPLNHGNYLISLHDSTQLNLSRNYRDRLTAIFGSHF
jgi:two-component system, LytTR family, response regulator